MLHSIRVRLLLLTFGSLVLAMLVLGFALSAIFTSHIEREFNKSLADEFNRLVALVDPVGRVPRLSQDMPDPRFATALSGLYWQVSDPLSGETSRSRSLWDQGLALPPLEQSDGPGSFSLTQPDGTPLAVLARRLTFEGDEGPERVLDLAVAESRTSLDEAVASFRFDLMRALVVLAIVLLLAGWIQVGVGLAPLKGLRDRINAVRRGEARHLEGAFPTEVQPLVEEVNGLLDAQERSIGYARARATDLAHALKTPLTVLGVETRSLRQRGQDDAANRIDEVLASMSGTVHHQLGLARLRHRARSEHCATPLGEVVEKVVQTLRNTPEGEHLVWQRDVPADLAVNLDRSDLLELCGIVLENASQWAREQVSVGARLDRNRVHLVIEDDGPGFSSAENEPRTPTRGDPGHGQGLRIAREIVDLNGASLEASLGPSGGARVSISLEAA
jgi:signal transduction histidine kinase